jgi:hypothetical protein
MCIFEWDEKDTKVLEYDDPDPILMKDDVITDDFCILNYYLIPNTFWDIDSPSKLGKIPIDRKDNVLPEGH